MPITSPNIITDDDYARILESGEASPIKHGHPAVIMHGDDTVTKIWAKKPGLFSSSRWNPYSSRFIKNAQRLHELGIIVPRIIAHYRVRNSHVHMVQYNALEGSSIRELLEQDPEKVDVLSLARYYHDLHQRGIIFRAIHFGNVIQLPDRQYGLIDFTDVSFYSKPVSLAKRAMNIATPLRYHQDIKNLKKNKLPEFSESYLRILKEQSDEIDETAYERIIAKRTRGKS